MINLQNLSLLCEIHNNEVNAIHLAVNFEIICKECDSSNNLITLQSAH